MPCLTIVVPCYNEDLVIGETIRRLAALQEKLVSLGKIAPESTALFVDDGSTDQTWALIQQYYEQGFPIQGIRLSRNRGHQHALLAGLMASKGDVVISLDADLQDDLAAIAKMLDEHRKGAEIVYGIRRQRTVDTWFKRASAEAFYRLLRLLGVETIYNHADYRLLSRRALDAMRDFREVNLYLRGIIPLIGFKSAVVHYERSVRYAGESKYPIRKMLALALNAITSLSTVPLRLISLLGIFVSALSVILSIWALLISVFTSQAVAGWASTVLPIYFLGGIQLLSLGVIGEYIGRIYLESKRRPRYIIDAVTGGLSPVSDRHS